MRSRWEGGGFKKPPLWTGGFPSAFEMVASWFARIGMWLLPAPVLGWLVIRGSSHLTFA
jgi:hypothetical protein